MRTEAQKQLDVTPEKAIQGNSDESKPKSGRGGARKGAGRHPNTSKQLLKGFTRQTIAEAADKIDCWAVISALLKSKSERTRLETLVFIRHTLYGRPAQAVSVSGAVLHAHWTPGKYSHLTDEEFAKLAELSAKALAPAASNALPDAPQNQTESNAAIEDA
jgi:hypothetical protein